MSKYISRYESIMWDIERRKKEIWFDNKYSGNNALCDFNFNGEIAEDGVDGQLSKLYKELEQTVFGRKERVIKNKINYGGILHTLSSLARMTGINPGTLRTRLVVLKWDIRRALSR